MAFTAPKFAKRTCSKCLWTCPVPNFIQRGRCM